jgi:hypothetical protein
MGENGRFMGKDGARLQPASPHDMGNLPVAVDRS